MGLDYKWEVRVDVFVFRCLSWSPERCSAAATSVRAGQGALEGVAGLNAVVGWLSWCCRNQSLSTLLVIWKGWDLTLYIVRISLWQMLSMHYGRLCDFWGAYIA